MILVKCGLSDCNHPYARLLIMIWATKQARFQAVIWVICIVHMHKMVLHWCYV